MRKMVQGALLLLLIGLVAACVAYREQHARGVEEASHSHHQHHAAPSAEFTALPDNEQLARVRGEVEEAKKNLEKQGKYACCVRPACNECLLKYGECHCREAVRQKGPCCGECTEAWVEGRGAVEGVSAWELLERKKKALQDREGKQEDPKQE